ncbi:MAG: hypothetical protein KY428_07460 [Bacteroidetes bacterium]|nr:hypothetical protein [Bacteroidota bacterium]
MKASYNQDQYPAREKGCKLEYLSKAPTDRKYEILGDCTGKGMNGLGRTNYEAAFKRVEDCACKNGGNAIILTDGYSEGFHSRGDFGIPEYNQTNVAVRAVIIFIEE